MLIKRMIECFLKKGVQNDGGAQLKPRRRDNQETLSGGGVGMDGEEGVCAAFTATFATTYNAGAACNVACGG
jgi:hypothetical protein